MNPFAPLRGREPTAPHTGPFPGADFLGVWWQHRGTGEPLVVVDANGAVALTVNDGHAGFGGEADLTDYHSPLGSAPASALVSALEMLAPGTVVDFDSLPAEACSAVVEACDTFGRSVVPTEHTVAMVLDLPDDPDAYLESLDGKQRHEVRRKRRRFVETIGEPVLIRDMAAFDEFARMHRAAAGAKGSFLDGQRERFFGDLLKDAGAVIDVLHGDGGIPVAAAFGFEDADTYYLYNSAFDPAFGAASPGIVLVHLAIEAAIRSGRRRFDFLKGDETYKLRLGARPRPLFRIEVGV